MKRLAARYIPSISTSQCVRNRFSSISALLLIVHLVLALVTPNAVLGVVAWSRQGMHSATPLGVYLVMIGLPILLLFAVTLFGELSTRELFWLACLLIFLIAVVRSRSSLVFLNLYVCYLLGRVLCKAHRKTVFYIMLAFLASAECASIIAHVCSWHQFITPGFGERSCWPYASPNVLYPICLVGFCSFLGLSISGCQSAILTRISSIGTVVSGLALLLTFSRAGWIGASIALAYAANRFIPSVRLLSFLCALLMLFGAATVRTRGSIASIPNDRSLAGRAFIWKHAARDLSRQPWLGYGYNSFEKSIAYSKSIEKSGTAPREPKNWYLSICYDFGLVGLGAFTMAVICSLKSALWIIRQHPFSVIDRSLAYAVLLSLLSLLIAGCFDTPICGDLMRINGTIVILTMTAMLQGAANKRL